MDLRFTNKSWDQYLYWKQNDKKLSNKIDTLLTSVQRSPFSGIGKPELLRGDKSGLWSRRINQEHRLVYKITESAVIIIACRYHY